ncbi:uncharacterized protein SCHCODRAFT_01166225 [Schizophyllum commune H4-8]|uniref:Uncharacterized protein n=1 Tax=Schizophyllum commune (strain H4-8 / FGSC 9210) TaxID=578458 RepID=D8PJT9_SCHCM|nr:uncharacterized protein SCHCODRAFT_01166225 [Schizophyllum commune H4-8]KAI5893989.1 hypothetical protein SCHCODRAFT_01166225 [Schizophyllum commune H4-8]
MTEIADVPNAGDSPISELHLAVDEYYSDRGRMYKCRSPLDFLSDHERMAAAKHLPLNLEERAIVNRLGVDILRPSLERVIQATPTLASLSPVDRQVIEVLFRLDAATLIPHKQALIDEFCSEATVLLEAKTHHFHPNSTTPSNTANSLFSLLVAVSRETHGLIIIDLWVRANLIPAMERVSHVLQSSAIARSSLELKTDQPMASSEPVVSLIPAELEQTISIATTSVSGVQEDVTSTGGVAEVATVVDPVSNAPAVSSFEVIALPEELASSLLEETRESSDILLLQSFLIGFSQAPQKRKNEDQPEMSSPPLKKAKTTAGALKRATSMACRIPVARKSTAIDKGKEVAAPPSDGESAAPKMKGSRSAAFLRKPFGPTPPLPKWKPLCRVGFPISLRQLGARGIILFNLGALEGMQRVPTFNPFPGPHACASD